jgi:hypothetical protein
VSDPRDQRQLDLVAYGITPDGIPLCCDATMVSPLRANGEPIPRAAANDGVALARAELRKREHYSELVGNTFGRLVVLGCETGGRWSQDCLRIVATATKHKARSAPLLLRTSARAAWSSRWWSMLSVACQTALAQTLLGTAPSMRSSSGWDEADLSAAWEHGPLNVAASRLPLRG